MLYLVRHAKAGSRADWVGDDRLRPLTEGGCRQAEALAERLAPLVAAADAELVSSPYLRCVQTIEPLATRLGRSVRLDERLAEEAGFHNLSHFILRFKNRFGETPGAWRRRSAGIMAGAGG